MTRFAWSLVLLAATPPLFAQEPPAAFRLVHKGDALVSGRVFVVLSDRDIGGRVFTQSWFNPEPFFAQDVADWPDGDRLDFAPRFAFPVPIRKMKPGKYHVQAILDRGRGQNPLSSPGNLYSKSRVVDFDPKTPKSVDLVLDQIVPSRSFVEKPRVKLFEVDSPLLTKFHGRPTKLRAGVVLPKSFADDPKRTYPVVYEIPGFGGDHHLAFAAEGRDTGGVDAVQVALDPTCPRGHHAFADSANNGPVGAALVHELIPALEKKYRGSGQRFLTGHSSGGWSGLWLQIAYPDFFDGVWSTAPDSVDFRDFQKVDIYENDANLFFDARGDLRPLARKDGKTAFTYKRFSDMEVVLGRGGQLFSFEAVFSDRGIDGEPLRLWNRETGAISPAVAESWKAYDIRRILEANWPALAPKLKGKIHIVMGAEDTFFLEGATRLLKAGLEKWGSDAVVEIVPGKHHGNLLDAALRRRIAREMAERVRAAATLPQSCPREE